MVLSVGYLNVFCLFLNRVWLAPIFQWLSCEQCRKPGGGVCRRRGLQADQGVLLHAHPPQPTPKELATGSCGQICLVISTFSRALSQNIERLMGNVCARRRPDSVKALP
eukprot:5797674-Amphidinium_carterae.2